NVETSMVVSRLTSDARRDAANCAPLASAIEPRSTPLQTEDWYAHHAEATVAAASKADERTSAACCRLPGADLLIFASAVLCIWPGAPSAQTTPKPARASPATNAGVTFAIHCQTAPTGDRA